MPHRTFWLAREMSKGKNIQTRTLDLNNIEDYVEETLPCVYCYQPKKIYSPSTHGDATETLERSLPSHEHFKNWANASESGICFLRGICGIREHRNVTCNTLPRIPDLNLMIQSKGPSAKFYNIRLGCFRRLETTNEWVVSHPLWMTISMIQKLCDIIASSKDFRGFISLEETDTCFDKQEYCWENSIAILEQVILAFKEVYPRRYLSIFIEHVPSGYPWAEDLGTLLHVLSQIARLPTHMPYRLKVMFTGSMDSVDKVLDSYKRFLKTEEKGHSKAGVTTMVGRTIYGYYRVPVPKCNREEGVKKKKHPLPCQDLTQEQAFLDFTNKPEEEWLLVKYPQGRDS